MQTSQVKNKIDQNRKLLNNLLELTLKAKQWINLHLAQVARVRPCWEDLWLYLNTNNGLKCKMRFDFRFVLTKNLESAIVNINLDYRFVLWRKAFLSRIVLSTRHLQDLTQCRRRCRCPSERSPHWGIRHGHGAGPVCDSSEKSQQQGCQPGADSAYLCLQGTQQDWPDLIFSQKEFKRQSLPCIC